MKFNNYYIIYTYFIDIFYDQLLYYENYNYLKKNII